MDRSWGFRWSADPNYALFSVILIDIWIYTPFVVILALAGLRSLPKSPYEAALIDAVRRGSFFVT
jgi:multiple sugar transport system permease protein